MTRLSVVAGSRGTLGRRDAVILLAYHISWQDNYTVPAGKHHHALLASAAHAEPDEQDR
jgi:hypothetical protein